MAEAHFLWVVREKQEAYPGEIVAFLFYKTEDGAMHPTKDTVRVGLKFGAMPIEEMLETVKATIAGYPVAPHRCERWVPRAEGDAADVLGMLFP